VAGFCEHGNEPSASIKKAGFYLKTWVTISFSTNILRHGVSINCRDYLVSNVFLEVFWVLNREGCMWNITHKSLLCFMVLSIKGPSSNTKTEIHLAVVFPKFEMNASRIRERCFAGAKSEPALVLILRSYL
jgi:hypothetical protein